MTDAEREAQIRRMYGPYSDTASLFARLGKAQEEIARLTAPPGTSALERAIDFLWPHYQDDKLPKMKYAAKDPQCQRLAAEFEEVEHDAFDRASIADQAACNTTARQARAAGKIEGMSISTDERQAIARIARAQAIETVIAFIAFIEGGHFLHDDAPIKRFARECVAGIRRHFATTQPAQPSATPPEDRKATLVLRPYTIDAESRVTKWSLQLRRAGMSETEYITFATGNEAWAREVVEAGAPYWLFGDPRKETTDG